MYYGGAVAASMMSSSRSTEFIQLTREVELPGRLEEGSYDFPFVFKNVDLEIETHIGVAMVVEYSVQAEMVYAGNMMQYTCKAKEAFAVSNYRSSGRVTQQVVSRQSPEVTLALASPLINMQLHLDSCRLNCETDWISGWFKGRECIQIEQIKSVRLEIVQKEIQGVISKEVASAGKHQSE